MEVVVSCLSLKIYLWAVILFMEAVTNCPSLKIYLRWPSYIAHLSKSINKGRPLQKRSPFSKADLLRGLPLETGPKPTIRPNMGGLPQLVRAQTDSDARVLRPVATCARCGVLVAHERSKLPTREFWVSAHGFGVRFPCLPSVQGHLTSGV